MFKRLILLLFSILLLACDSDSSTTNVENIQPPQKPYFPYPGDLATEVDLSSFKLNWQCEAQDNENLRFNVYFGTSNPPMLVAKEIINNYYNPTNLSLGTTYYWKIEAKNDEFIVSSPVWKFTTHHNKEIVFSDENVERLVRAETNIQDREIKVDDVIKITYLDWNNQNINDLEGMEYFENLRYFDLSNNNIESIFPISDLRNLLVLSLKNNQLSDISELSDLINVYMLDLAKNNIEDISSLSQLTNLSFLELSDNVISDISLIKNLTSLRFINISDNNVSDISSLSDLEQLQFVSIEKNNITNLKSLVDNENFAQGDILNIKDNPLDEISINEYIPILINRGVEVNYE